MNKKEYIQEFGWEIFDAAEIQLRIEMYLCLVYVLYEYPPPFIDEDDLKLTAN